MSRVYEGDDALRRLGNLPDGEATVVLTRDYTLAVVVRAPHGADPRFFETAAAGMLRAARQALDEFSSSPTFEA